MSAKAALASPIPYDQTDFVTSIALRAADHGGDFEYAPLIRSATDENYIAEKRLLLGSNEGVVHVAMNLGCSRAATPSIA